MFQIMRCQRTRRPGVKTGGYLTLCLTAVCCGGCEAPTSPPGGGLVTSTGGDHAGSGYPDLGDRPFKILADFEMPDAAAMFVLRPERGPGGVALTSERARPGTGSVSLKLSLYNSIQRVIFRDTPDHPDALHRDWSPYQLLVFSVFSERRLGGFRFSVVSGTHRPLVYHHRRIFLEAGWNEVQVDLGDMMDALDLGDVREIHFGCDPLDTPTDLYLDDVMLVEQTENLYAADPEAEGALYVVRRGQRLAVGARRQFELVFARGRIRQWFDLARDPGRTCNLVGAGALGPEPAMLGRGRYATPLDEDREGSVAASVEVRQTLVEANPLRATVLGEQLLAESRENDKPSPYQRWMYTVYADGRVFVECGGVVDDPMLEFTDLGMVFCVDDGLGFERRIIEGQSGDRPFDPQRGGGVLFARTGRGEADLLVVPYSSAPVRIVEQRGDPRLGVAWPVPLADHPFVFAAMLCVRPDDLDARLTARTLAGDYAQPLPLEVDIGHLVRTDPGDFDVDGYAESRGHYVIQLDGNIGRIRLDPARQMRFSPTFLLAGVADQDVSIYVDGRLLRGVYRGDDGQLLFQIPGWIARDVLIELSARAR